MVINDSQKASKPIDSPHWVRGPCIHQNSLFVAVWSAFLGTEQAAHARCWGFLLSPRQKCRKEEELMLISRLHGHIEAIRSTRPVPGAHLIRGESRSAIQSLSTRTNFGDQQYSAAFAAASATRMARIMKAGGDSSGQPLPWKLWSSGL